MNTTPRVGTEIRDDWTIGLCAYAPDEKSPQCLDEATWHGIVNDTVDEAIGLPSCDKHKPVMEPLARYVHRHEAACGLPGSRFQREENRCRLLI